MESKELKKAQEAIEMLQQLNLPVGEQQLEVLAAMEKEYLEKEVLPPAIEVMRSKVSGLKNTFLVSVKYSEKDGLQLESIEVQIDKTPKDKAEDLATVKDIDESRYLGVDPVSGKKVYVKVTKRGLLAQLGELNTPEKPKFARLRRGTDIDEVTLEEVLSIFKFPRTLGFFEGKEVVVGIGPFGPYVKHNEKYYNLSREDDPHTISYERALEIVKAKRELGIGEVILEFENDPNIRVINGRFGPYIKYKKNNYKVPRQMTPSLLSYEDCLAIIKDPANAAQKWVPRNKQE